MPPASSLAAGQRQLGSAPAASRPRLPACGRVAAQAQEGNPHYRRSGGENNPRSNPNYRRGSQNDYWRKRENDRKSSRGASVSADNATRRRGRSAHLRSPDDTPLRDGNRDRLMGLLTDRAARTLELSVAEGNPALHQWLKLYLDEHDIPKDGNWSDVSGENFLRRLLTKPVEEISGSFSEEDDSFLTQSPVGGDPRAIAQRIMDLRHEIAKEWISELEEVKAENMLLLNESLMKSLQPEGEPAPADPAAEAPAVEEGTPKKKVDIEELDESAGGGDD